MKFSSMIAAIALSGVAIVRAQHGSPPGSVIYKCSSGTACVEGNSSGKKTYGVLGFSSHADGVHGLTHSTTGSSAVGGVADAKYGVAQGVFGRSSNGAGVYGATSGANDNGVEGHTLYGPGSETGVYGDGGTVGTGVYGNAHIGVYGESGYPAITQSAVAALSDDANIYIFWGVGPGSAYCTIDSAANLACSGTINGGAPRRMRQRSDNGERVLYGAESASATIQDAGTARLSGGVANVRIDPAFASVMDGKWYYVLLTPLGDTRGLYVSVKTPTAFQVREAEHGHSSLEFDYRIVAHPIDADNDRLPPAPEIRRPLIRAQPGGR